MLEVEVKAAGSNLESKLIGLGGELLRAEGQEDLYSGSFWRDLRKSDEALRVRTANGRYVLTYKGPKVDLETKTREEVNSPVSNEIIDINVGGLGDFIEVESESLSVKGKIFELLEGLGIRREDTIRESYLELLEKRK
ncbi:MAG: class IV adenylate cyclase [Candidatus Altiarchaeota archaeon]|nr:class IV adenylate cyclase [Candidatus Altiarchaeota archaeon]